MKRLHLSTDLQVSLQTGQTFIAGVTVDDGVHLEIDLVLVSNFAGVSECALREENS